MAETIYSNDLKPLIVIRLKRPGRLLETAVQGYRQNRGLAMRIPFIVKDP
jgi:hypothetical protein